MDDQQLISNVYRKIEREQKLIDGANAMRQSTDNPSLQQRLESQIREGRKNIGYLEERMRELQMRRLGQGVEGMSVGAPGNAPYPGSPHGSMSTTPNPYQQGPGPGGAPPPPPKDTRAGYGSPPDQGRGDYGDPGPGGYSEQGGRGMMPPRAPFGPPGPAAVTPKARPNYSKLDLIKYDTPYLGPRIQLMLSQLEFKLSVEKQYKDGIEKMVRLYQIEGDRKSRADAENRRVESNQKIQLLKQALKRYEDLHVDMESNADSPDDDSLNTPNMRKPLTGQLSIRIFAVKDVDHATTGRFGRGPETFVNIKVEDSFKGRTKSTRTDRWADEFHVIDVDKANEVELTIYDKSGDHPLPIGMLWVRISDIVEEMRRKKIESEFNNSGWVSADKMGSGSMGRPDGQYPTNYQAPQFGPPPHAGGGQAPPYNNAPGAPQPAPPSIEAWFALEPVGRIHLGLSFAKQQKDSGRLELGLNRKGAIRQRKEEVHEMYGHKFIDQQFYNIMRCALCGDFLKYAAGMQCADCRYTCHKKCYPKVVTKCISKSNNDMAGEEEKLNHRIPHRFEGFSNMGANWCCHCGYILPLGKKNCRKCTECGLTAHAQCLHFVPDFCGMPMEVANQILSEIRTTKRRQTSTMSSMSSRTLRPTSGRPTPPPAGQTYGPPPGQEQYGQPPPDTRRMSGQDSGQEASYKPASYSPASTTSLEAAKASYNLGSPPLMSPQHQRPDPQRSSTSQPAAAAAAAAAALTGKRTPSQKGPGQPYQRSSTDYASNMAAARTSVGYAPSMGSHVELDAGYGQPAHQAQQPQQPTYNPASYAAVDGYPPQQAYPPQQPVPPPQQLSPSKAGYGAPSAAPMPLASPPPQSAIPGQQQALERKETPQHTQQGPGRRIGLDHFNFLAVLGKGNFGKVMLAETKSTKQLYAIKVLKKEFIIENDEVESTRSEKRVFLIANKERHPFLLNLHACFQTETRVYFVMEYISGGDLMLHIQRGQFGTKRAQFYAAEVCLALKYFHENGVIYRDLKLDNILLTLDGHIKIADYGLCKEEMWYGCTTSTFCGTPEFMAPEILLDKKYGRAVDWWAFGVLIYQMLLQQSPFRGEDEDEIYDAILADEPLYPIHMPRDSVSILQKLLTREPELRLGSGPTDAQEIMSHAFFRNINWEDVYHKRIPAPFQPQIKSATDTSNFDQEFTSVTPVLTPVQSVLSQAMQEEFRGFSYSADFV
ncbi:MAG: Serine/threonine kinase [Thelocarpon superellum]|nr:MAG: Serine/threonine kinase [Thelocarpon superellum]